MRDSGILPTSKDFGRFYKLGRKIGEGTYSEVFEAIKVSTNEKVAVKICTVKDGDESGNVVKTVRREIEVLKTLNHPNIVKLVDHFEDEGGTTFFVVLELLEGGELSERLGECSFFSEDEARGIILTLLPAIKYLHDQDVVHRYFTCSRELIFI